MGVLNLRVATLNISGGEKTFEEYNSGTQKSRQEALEMLIKRLDANILCLQEVSQYIDADGITHSLVENINKAGHYNYSFFGKTLSMETHMQVKKDVMVKGIFNDWWDWSKGNSIHARIPFARLSDPTRPGVPRNIPLYQPAVYEGNRDTEPRFALLTRLKEAPSPYIINLHLTTLVGERTIPAQPQKIKESQSLRCWQIQRLLDLVRVHILQQEQPIILAGDFNATADEFGIAQLLESENGFIRLVPENEGPTHSELEKPIDHIFFYPRQRLAEYSCRIDTGELSKRASDHLPTVANISIK
jgi:endonuclease/exonuclease/phosphatase family metal-dependent hydrolase